MAKAGLRKKRRLYFMVTSLAALGLATALVLFALTDKIELFYDPTEVAERDLKVGKHFRIGGLVVADSFSKQEIQGVLVNQFQVTDGNKSLAVRYEGILPDLFREGQGVVAEGALNDDRVFIATRVLAKHDEKYLPKEVVDSLKKRGQWKDDRTSEESKP